MSYQFSNEIKIVAEKYLKAAEGVEAWKEWVDFQNSTNSLLGDSSKTDIYLNSVDPRFNSISWAKDVNSMTNQIQFGFCWMEAYSSWYQKEFDPESGPYSDFFPVSYFTDNCIIRINSCKDKIALMIWAYYCPFDIRKREEILDYKQVLKRLRHPIKFGLKLIGEKEFFKSLDKLNNNHFNEIKKFRHAKIHRKETKVIMGEVQNFHYRDYNFPMLEQSEIKEWEEQMESKGEEKDFINRMKNAGTFDGVQYKSEKVDDFLVSYSEVKEHIENSFKILLKETAICFKILDSRLFTATDEKGT